MAENYAYKYATLRLDMNGLCDGVSDTSAYILDPTYVPIYDDSVNFLLKYYYPVPEEVTCFADFQGLFYLDAAHTIPFDEGNAVLRTEE